MSAITHTWTFIWIGSSVLAVLQICSTPLSGLLPWTVVPRPAEWLLLVPVVYGVTGRQGCGRFPPFALLCLPWRALQWILMTALLPPFPWAFPSHVSFLSQFSAPESVPSSQYLHLHNLGWSFPCWNLIWFQGTFFVFVYNLYVRVSACSVMSDSLWPHGLEPARLLCPWDSPGKKTGAVCYFLLQGIFWHGDCTCISCTGRQILHRYTTNACSDSWGRKESDTTERLNWLTDWHHQRDIIYVSFCVYKRCTNFYVFFLFKFLDLCIF